MPTFDRDKFGDDLVFSKPGKMAGILASLDEDDAEVVEAALRDLSVPANALAKALTKQGFTTGAQPVITWRAKHVTT